jgi:hypothetical protein
MLCRNVDEVEFELAVDGAESFNVVDIQRATDVKMPD